MFFVVLCCSYYLKSDICFVMKMFACAPYTFCHIKLLFLSFASASDSSKTVPVSVSIEMPRGKSYSVGSTLSILCNVTGEPTPEVSWYKDNQALEASNNIEIPGEHRLRQIRKY